MDFLTLENSAQVSPRRSQSPSDSLSVSYNAAWERPRSRSPRNENSISLKSAELSLSESLSGWSTGVKPATHDVEFHARVYSMVSGSAKGSAQGFTEPRGITVMKRKRNGVNGAAIQIAVTNAHCIDIIDPIAGVWLYRVGKQGSAGIGGSCEFNEPRGIVALSHDEEHSGLAVVDTRNHRVVVVHPRTGTAMKSFGSYGSGSNQFNYPHAIDELQKGQVVVSDTMNHRVQIIDIVECRLLRSLGAGEGSKPGQLRRPKGVAVLGDGAIAVADHDNNRIQIFDPFSGAALRCIGGNNAFGTSSLLGPNGLAVLPHGAGLLVCEETNHRLNIVDPYAVGEEDPFRRTIGAPGTGGMGKFNFPFGAATLPNGYVVVADSNNNRLQILR